MFKLKIGNQNTNNLVSQNDDKVYSSTTSKQEELLINTYQTNVKNEISTFDSH